MSIRNLLAGAILALSASSGYAQTFGTVRGTIVDPQGGPIPDAGVTLKAQASAFTKESRTDAAGAFTFAAVPADSYAIEIEHSGFETMSQIVDVRILSAPVLKFSMKVAGIEVEASVAAPAETAGVNVDASSPPVIVHELDIQHTPGADRAASVAFITDFVPGSFLLHDHLHMRGGHQVSWLIDGVPVPNTNLSSNVGRQLDPKDVQNVEVSRGGYSAKYGDRTYGMVNIIPRSGFEFNKRELEAAVGYGSFNQTNNQLSLGGHTDKFAYYGSISANRTDLGLEPPETIVLHNNGSGVSGFTSLAYNLTDTDQLRLTSSVRRDHYWIPNTAVDQALGIRDIDQENDAFTTFSWVHTFNSGALLTLSPFYHYNQAQYAGGPNDPLITNDHRSSQYGGAQAVLGIVRGPHNLNTGVYAFHQHDNRDFGLKKNDADVPPAFESQRLGGNLQTVFLDDQFKPTEFLTLNGGVRLTHYSAGINENSADPRIGASIQIPRLNWVARAFYGRYYQAPPLSTLGGPVLEFAVQQGFGFLPLKGERDRQYELGLSIPLGKWGVDFARFDTAARNFSDHDVLGNSNITLPLSIQRVHSRGTEATLHSPSYRRRLHFHLAYSNMIVQGIGAVTGGMTNFAPPANRWFFIDHDQRQTLSAGGELTLPRAGWINSNLLYGSGFLDGDGPQHLPQHTSLDFAAGKAFGYLSISFNALNVTNARYLLGRASSFAGTHYNDPRQFTVQLRYRFHL
jgi:outer membrane cobalamin receptor